jgi:hypothetical protein
MAGGDVPRDVDQVLAEPRKLRDLREALAKLSSVSHRLSSRRGRVSKRELYALVGNKQQMPIACISEGANRTSRPTSRGLAILHLQLHDIYVVFRIPGLRPSTYDLPERGVGANRPVTAVKLPGGASFEYSLPMTLH